MWLKSHFAGGRPNYPLAISPDDVEIGIFVRDVAEIEKGWYWYEEDVICCNRHISTVRLVVNWF